jgi:HSF-type DNA-binding
LLLPCSFQRQLNLYGFQRLTRGPDAGGYYHELFLRGREFLCQHLTRTKVKGTKFKAASNPDHEPDFYHMPFLSGVVVTRPSSDDESSYESARAEPLRRNSVGTRKVVKPLPALSSAVEVTTSSSTAANDPILDEAVRELFLEDDQLDAASLNEFVHDWDPEYLMGDDIDDDWELGLLLEGMVNET